MVTTKTKKKIPGKSAVGVNPPVYKPTMWLESKQIPKELAATDVGKTVNLNVTAKIVRRTEDARGPSSVNLELNSIGVVQPKKSKKK